MNILGLNINITRSRAAANQKSQIANQKSFDPQLWLTGENFHGSGTLSNAYEQSAWVYRAVNAIAEQVANIPFLFSRGERGRENLITSGPLHTFYNRPSSTIDRFQYWELRILWLLLRGECFRLPVYSESSPGLHSLGDGGSIPVPDAHPSAYPVRARGPGIPLGPRTSQHSPTPALQESTTPSLHDLLQPRRKLLKVLFLDPARMHPIIQDHQLAGWRHTGNPASPVSPQVLLPEEVWHDKLPNPYDPYRGLAPFHVADMATRTDFAAANHMRAILQCNADTGLIIRADNQLTDEQREQIVASLRDRRLRRSVSPNTCTFLWGATEVIQPTLSSADLQLLENRKFSRAEICAAFGIPEEIITTSDHNKYDVMRGARLNFIENRIAPLCARLEAAEQETVRAIDPAATGWFDLESLPIMQDARRQRLASARAAFEMGIPLNELNRLLDLGIKPFPWGDIPYVPSTLQPVTSTSPALQSFSGGGRT